MYLLDDHEVVRRGLRQLLESNGLAVAGESASALEAARRIPVLAPDLVILDDEVPDGSGADVCRAVAAAVPTIRCLLMTEAVDEAECLIDSILAGAWGCLSKRDDSMEQFRLIRRALDGYTAYSRSFRPALRDRWASPVRPGPSGLRLLTRQEMNAAIRLGKGMTNRQIAKEMFLAEKTVKNMVSSMLAKLGVSRRSRAGVLVSAAALRQSEDASDGRYRFSVFPDLAAEVSAALLSCTSEARTTPPTDDERARDALRLFDALAAARTGSTVFRTERSPA